MLDMRRSVAGAAAHEDKQDAAALYHCRRVHRTSAFGGNPLAVVLDAGGLSTAQMQAIATEFNYSETTFVLPPQEAANDAKVRIFTVRTEIPLRRPSQCRHRLRAGDARGDAAGAAEIRGEGRARAGRDPVRAGQGDRRRADRAAAAEAAVDEGSAAEAAACLSLSADDMRIDRHHAAGRLGRPAVPGGRDRLARGAEAGPARCRAFARVLAHIGRDVSLFLHARRAGVGEQPLDLQARMFHPGASGLSEDPATGSATARRRGAARRSSTRRATASCGCGSGRASTWAGRACCSRG